VLLIAAFALIRHANDLSMWYDELWTIFHSSGTLAQIVRDRDWSWPPGYFVLLHAWIRLFGMNDLVVRMMNVLAGLLGTALMIRAGRALDSHRAGWMAGLAFATSNYAVYFLLEVRGYSLMLVLTAGLVWVHARWLKQPTWRRAILYVIVQALLFYTRFVDSMLIAALLGLRVALISPRRVGRWIGVMVMTGVLFVPLLPQFRDFYRIERRASDKPRSGYFPARAGAVVPALQRALRRFVGSRPAAGAAGGRGFALARGPGATRDSALARDLGIGYPAGDLPEPRARAGVHHPLPAVHASGNDAAGRHWAGAVARAGSGDRRVPATGVSRHAVATVRLSPLLHRFAAGARSRARTGKTV